MIEPPKIVLMPAKKIVGLYLKMNLIENQTPVLWKEFMPHKNSIKNKVDENVISLSSYNEDYFSQFNPANHFQKWACVEVSDYDINIPGLKTGTVEEGLYAVFNYKGSSADHSIFQYIYGTWIHQSDFSIDNRPHFEILGKNYRNNDPDSEEEIWIPIKRKNP